MMRGKDARVLLSHHVRRQLTGRLLTLNTDTLLDALHILYLKPLLYGTS